LSCTVRGSSSSLPVGTVRVKLLFTSCLSLISFENCLSSELRQLRIQQI
jgi:hypothetical protein